MRALIIGSRSRRRIRRHGWPAPIGLTLVVDRLSGLRGAEVTEDAITVGAALTLTELEAVLAGRVPLLDEVWPQFASRLIRNGATVGGNQVCNTTPVTITEPTNLIPQQPPTHALSGTAGSTTNLSAQFGRASVRTACRTTRRCCAKSAAIH